MKIMILLEQGTPIQNFPNMDKIKMNKIVYCGVIWVNGGYITQNV